MNYMDIAYIAVVVVIARYKTQVSSWKIIKTITTTTTTTTIKLILIIRSHIMHQGWKREESTMTMTRGINMQSCPHHPYYGTWHSPWSSLRHVGTHRK
jgi:hypothetical protein